MSDYVKIEKGLGPEGRIAVVRFDRGDGINALSPEALRQLTAAARSFEDDAATSVVVLTGSADAFSAGFDLKDAEGRSRKDMDLGTLRQHLKLGPRLTRLTRAPMYFGSGYIGKGQFWGFGLIFGVLYFAGLLLIVLPWLQVH
ncbi:enoyl-CoA hydratase/carnithine racemase [Bradyrhizobium sp. LB1.3]